MAGPCPCGQKESAGGERVRGVRKSVLIGAVVCMALAVSGRIASAQELPTFDRALVDYFLKLDGIPGESVDSRHRGEIDVESFNHGATQMRPSGAGMGVSAGRANVADLVITKRFDAASPKLFLACCKGNHLKEAVLVGRKPGRSPVEFLKVTLQDVVVTSYRIMSGGDVPTEEVSLSFARVDYTYTT